MQKSNFNRRMVFVSLTAAVFCLTFFVNCSNISYEFYYERGALTTAAPIATDIGREVFKEGGNSYDVAVAVGFVLAVVHPEAGNIGGGGFAMVRDGKSGDIKALDFRETAPSAAYEQMYLKADSQVIENLSTFGAKAVGVPGTVAGLYKLWQDNGNLPWDKLLGYAAALADTGFVVDQYLSDKLESQREKLSVFPQSAEIFFPEGEALRSGDTLYQKNLARAIYLIAAEGPEVFYRGDIADSIETTMIEYDGLISKNDLGAYKSLYREPIHFEFDSLDIYSMPPPSSGGILLAQILQMLSYHKFSHLSAESPEYIHLFTEAAKLAYADRAEYLGDPDFYNVSIDMLIDKSYSESRAALISRDTVLPSENIKAGMVSFEESDQTTHYSICDSDGNMISVTYTLNTSFGSKLMVNGFGILLNNEMDDFSVKPGVPNTYGLVGGEANKIERAKGCFLR